MYNMLLDLNSLLYLATFIVFGITKIGNNYLIFVTLHLYSYKGNLIRLGKVKYFIYLKSSQMLTNPVT